MKKILFLNLFIIFLWGCEKDPVPGINNPFVTTGTATEIGIINTKIHLTLSNIQATQEIGVMYGQSSNFLNIQKVSSYYIKQGENIIELTGLIPATDYYYKSYASDGNTSVYGEVKMFTTLSSSKATVVTGVATNIKSKSFTVSATLTGFDLVEEWGIVMDLSDSNTASSGRFDKFNYVAEGMTTMGYTTTRVNQKIYYSSYAKLKTGIYIYGDIRWVQTAGY